MAIGLAEELRTQEPQRNAEFLIEPNLTAHADANLIRAVLNNLLSNAWKFSAQQPRTRIEFGKMIREGVPTFFVRDNGCGFDMTYASKLFRPFQRLHPSDEYPGTGIGLANVQRIIRRHGGHVAIEGAVGQGATVFFTLPTNGTSSAIDLEA
jgi:light-regulated signal transduction histidine kinase (bacteriophytochrome)